MGYDLVLDDAVLEDVVTTAEELLLRISLAPPCVRPWLREAEAALKHTALEAQRVRNREAQRVLDWIRRPSGVMRSGAPGAEQARGK